MVSCRGRGRVEARSRTTGRAMSSTMADIGLGFWLGLE
jgi:hypothetical protein